MESPDSYTPIRQLCIRHGLIAHHDPGGVELIHPRFGKFRIWGWDDDEDMAIIRQFLIDHGETP